MNVDPNKVLQVRALSVYKDPETNRNVEHKLARFSGTGKDRKVSGGEFLLGMGRRGIGGGLAIPFDQWVDVLGEDARVLRVIERAKYEFSHFIELQWRPKTTENSGLLDDIPSLDESQYADQVAGKAVKRAKPTKKAA